MAAVAVDTSTTAVVAADPDNHRRVKLKNLGPNAIYVEIGAAAVVATSYHVAATSGEATFDLPPGVALNAITTSAIQSTPQDTRVLVT